MMMTMMQTQLSSSVCVFMSNNSAHCSPAAKQCSKPVSNMPTLDSRICGNAGNSMSTCARPGCRSFGTGCYANGMLRSGCAYWLNPSGAHVGVAAGCDCACWDCIARLGLKQPEKEYPESSASSVVKPDDALHSSSS